MADEKWRKHLVRQVCTGIVLGAAECGQPAQWGVRATARGGSYGAFMPRCTTHVEQTVVALVSHEDTHAVQIVRQAA